MGTPQTVHAPRPSEDVFVVTYAAPYSGGLLTYVPAAEQEGRGQGAQNLPRTSETAPDQTEGKFEHAARKIHAECLTFFSTKIVGDVRTLDNAESELNDSSFHSKLRSSLEQVHTKICALFSERRARLRSLCREKLEHEAAFNYFRRTNRLERPASYPVSHRAHYMLILAVAIVEAVANSLFYNRGVDMVTALIISFSSAAANVGMAVLLGNFFRFKNHLLPRTAALGWASLFTWATIAALLNHYLSAYRATVNPLVEQALAASTGIQAASPEQLSLQAAIEAGRLTFLGPMAGFLHFDLTSWCLFLLGIGISVIAFQKGYRSDDAYPGYGEADRTYRLAKEAYDSEERSLRTEVAGHVETARKEIDVVDRSSRTAFDTFSAARRLVRERFSSYQMEISRINQDLALLIDTYRKSNKSVRTTESPRYFETTASLPALPLSLDPRYEPSALDVKTAALEARLRDILSECSAIRKDLMDQEHSKTGEVDRFFVDVFAEARSEIGETRHLKAA